MIGTIFEIREFSLFDGPGIRTTVFLKGCPLRCLWCHNPEGVREEPELLVNPHLCRKCGKCRAVCPSGEREERGERVPFRGTSCNACGRCVQACPVRIRRICGERIDDDALVKRLVRHRSFFEAEGGGVTFSGGEPLLQAQWVALCAQRLRAEGISTAVETSGYASQKDYRRVISAVDLVIQDIKHPDSAIHKRWTGRSNEPILRNLTILKESNIPFIIRIPLIPRVNDSAEDLSAAASLLRGSDKLLRVELLPFHAGGRAKRSLLSTPSIPDTPESKAFWECHSPTSHDAAAIAPLTQPQKEELLRPFKSLAIPCRVA